MNGKSAFIAIFVWLISTVQFALGQQPIFIGPGIFIQSGSVMSLSPANSPAFLPSVGDRLEFLDGSDMHGELKRVDTNAGLRWDSPAAKSPIDLKPDHVGSIHFAHADSVTMTATSRLRFANGDDLMGTVTSLDNDHLGFSTWFGAALKIPRAAVQSITFLSHHYKILYEGPKDGDDWIIGNRNPDSWSLRDGVFTSTSSGTLGHDFDLSGSSTIEFDLGWSGAVEFLAYFYSDAVNHSEDFDNSYILEFTHNQAVSQITLRYLGLPGPAQLRTMGSASWVVPADQTKVRIAIQSNKEEGTFAVFVDNVLVKCWKDDKGFNATGGGVVFQEPGMSGSAVTLENIKVSQWDGRYEPETSTVSTNSDVVRFINHDKAAGKITGINDGKIALTLGENPLQIPISRVTQINFAAAPVLSMAHGPWDVRAHFPLGGSLSFQLQKWNDREVSGLSPVFGSVVFPPGQIRQLEFNLDHAKTPAEPPSGGEFEGFDE